MKETTIHQQYNFIPQCQSLESCESGVLPTILELLKYYFLDYVTFNFRVSQILLFRLCSIQLNKRFLSEREKSSPILVGHGKMSKSGILFKVIKQTSFDAKFNFESIGANCKPMKYLSCEIIGKNRGHFGTFF